MDRKLYYKIGEVADLLGVNISRVRFWSDNFPKCIKPERNAKGNRLFTEEDVECFKQIQFLIDECGMTLEGAARKMAEDRRPVSSQVKAVEILENIRWQLDEVRKRL